MKGKCIGGPLDGQEREADGLHLVTPVFVPNDMPGGSPPPALAGYMQQHVYRASFHRDQHDNIIKMWTYEGLR